MARFTLTISSDGLENLKKTQDILKDELGGSRISQGFAIAYVLKKFVEENSKEVADLSNQNKDN